MPVKRLNGHCAVDNDCTATEPVWKEKYRIVLGDKTPLEKENVNRRGRKREREREREIVEHEDSENTVAFDTFDVLARPETSSSSYFLLHVNDPWSDARIWRFHIIIVSFILEYSYSSKSPVMFKIVSIYLCHFRWIEEQLFRLENGAVDRILSLFFFNFFASLSSTIEVRIYIIKMERLRLRQVPAESGERLHWHILPQNFFIKQVSVRIGCSSFSEK